MPRFNRDLMKKRGESLGAEFKGKGVHVALGEFHCSAYKLDTYTLRNRPGCVGLNV